MEPEWTTKTHPEHHPVRFLENLWRQRMFAEFRVSVPPFSDKQFGQMRDLREAVGEDLALHFVEWMLKLENWWRFSQQVRVERKFYRVPPDPDIGFLLKHYRVGLKVIRAALQNSTDPADISFVQKLDQIRYEREKALVTVLSCGRPEWLARIAAAKTLMDIQRVFIAIADDNQTDQVVVAHSGS